MKRVLALAVLGALGAAAAGCDLSPPAATVGGVTISRTQLDARISSASSSAVVRCALGILSQADGTSLPAVTGVGDATVTTGFAAVELTGLVQQQVEAGALAQHHAVVTAADVATARADYEGELAAASGQVGSPCGLSGSALVSHLPGTFLDQQARSLAYDEKVEEVLARVDVSGPALLRYYDTHRSSLTQLCLNLIVANDQAGAQRIHDQVVGGTTFAAAAQSADANPNGPSGGAEPCVYPTTIASQLGAAVASVVDALADGQVAAPQSLTVTSSVTGQPSVAWLVIGMRQHVLAPFATVRDGIRLQLLAQARTALRGTLVRLASSASVELDPRYGTWSPAGGVTAPHAPPPASLLNPSTVDGGSGPGAGAPSGTG